MSATRSEIKFDALEKKVRQQIKEIASYDYAQAKELGGFEFLLDEVKKIAIALTKQEQIIQQEQIQNELFRGEQQADAEENRAHVLKTKSITKIKKTKKNLKIDRICQFANCQNNRPNNRLCSKSNHTFYRFYVINLPTLKLTISFSQPILNIDLTL